jgi:hypothetical protein
MVEMSETRTELFKAMVQFRKNLEMPKLDSSNPFFKSKFTSLAGVVDAVDKATEGTGLSFMQFTTGEGSSFGVQTMITHESGEYLLTDPTNLPLQKMSAQDAGGAVSYCKRYSLSAAFGIVSDVDDDGNAVSSKAKDDTTAIKAKLRDVAKLANSKGKSDLVDRARTAAKIPDAKKMKEALDAIQKELD